MKVINVSYLAIILYCSSFVVFSSQEFENKKDEYVMLTSIKQQSSALQNSLNTMMQDSASWLDSLAGEGNKNIDGASATGYLQFAWTPRAAELSELSPKFKVHLSLPRWNEKIALVLDNDDEDELMLDYEVSSVGTDNDTEKVNVAIQYIKTFNELTKVKFRLGLSRSQLYARSELKYRWKNESNTLTVVPRMDYFSQDGWAPSIKGSMIYPLMDSLLSFSASWQKVQKEKNSRQKIGFYHISNIEDTAELISGIQYSNNEYSEESLLVSIRQRNLLYKDWMFFELEPFIEFKQENNYRREFGLAIRLIAYYGK